MQALNMPDQSCKMHPKRIQKIEMLALRMRNSLSQQRQLHRQRKSKEQKASKHAQAQHVEVLRNIIPYHLPQDTIKNQPRRSSVTSRFTASTSMHFAFPVLRAAAAPLAQ